MDTARKKRPPAYDPSAPPPLVQILADQRARLDPSAVPQLAVWVLALRERYEQSGRMTLSGTTGRARKIRAGQIAWGQCMCQCIDALAQSLYETVDARAIDRAHAAMRAAMESYGQEVPQWPSHPNT